MLHICAVNANEQINIEYYELSQKRLKIASEFYRKWQLSGDISDYEKALQNANSAAELDQENDKAFALLGLIYSEAINDPESLDLATNAFVDALVLNPENFAVQVQLANILMKQKRYWSAIEVYENLLTKSENMITSANTAPLALCYIADRRIEAGVDYFAELEKKYPQNSGVLMAYSLLLKNNDQMEKAKEYIYKVIYESDAGEKQKAYAETLLNKWTESAQ